MATATELVTLRGHGAVIWQVQFSPDGTRLVTGSHDTTARIWDAATGAELAVLRGHTDVVWDVAVDSRGRTVATASGDGTAKLWDGTNGAEAGVLESTNSQPPSAGPNRSPIACLGARLSLPGSQIGACVVDCWWRERIPLQESHLRHIRGKGAGSPRRRRAAEGQDGARSRSPAHTRDGDSTTRRCVPANGDLVPTTWFSARGRGASSHDWVECKPEEILDYEPDDDTD